MKILVMTKNWLGDIFFQLPAMEAIHSRYPDAQIICVAPKRCCEILAAHPSVHHVLVFDEKREHRSLWAKLAFVFQLRKEKAQKAFLFHRSRTRAALTMLAGIKERIGYERGRRFFLTYPVKEPEGTLHQSEYFLDLVQKAGIPRLIDERYRFYLTQEDRWAVERLLDEYFLKSFCCFHVGANWSPKRWPVSHFAKLADLIFEKWKMPVVLTGGPEDASLHEEMIQRIKYAQVVSLAGKTSLRDLAAIYERSLFVVSGDSGPMHIAVAVGAKVVALFGPTSAALTGPRGVGEAAILQCVPPGYQTPFYGKELPASGWLSHIQPEEVLELLDSRGWYENQGSVLTNESIETGSGPGHNISSKEDPQILFVTLSNIGDVVMTIPVLMVLLKRYRKAKVTVVTSERGKGIFENSRFVDQVIVYDKKASWFAKLGFIRKLRRKKYDVVVDLRNTAIPFMVRAKKRSPLFRRFSETSFRKRHLEVLKMMGIAEEFFKSFDFFDSLDEETVSKKLRQAGLREGKGSIVVAPIAASELKTWPLEKFQFVMERLLQEGDEDILLVGDRRERELAELLVSICPSRIHNLAGQTTLRELAVLVQRSKLLLANDSAVMHLGFEMKKPVVALFGPTDPQKYGCTSPLVQILHANPNCFPCGKPICEQERRICFEELDPEKVYQACRELIDESKTVQSF